jgi:hypothetical protein
VPVRAAVRARLAPPDLFISPRLLDLGRAPLGERAGAELRITNTGPLPQAFSFGCGSAGRLRGLRVSPRDGYGLLQPGETARLLVSFAPAVPGPQAFALRCATLAGRVFSVAGRIEGVDPPLALSHNCVKVSCHVQRPSGAVPSAACLPTRQRARRAH